MTFQTEFPDFPATDMPAIPAGWTDQSWRNDSCPCFNTGNGALVYVDFADTSLREIPDGTRFNVQADPEIHGHNETFLDTDIWDEVLFFVANGCV